MTRAARTAKPADRPQASPLALAIAVVVLSILGSLTWRRGHAYRDEETLWRDTLRQNPSALIANNNLGGLLLLRGEVVPAKALFEAALRLKADDADALDNLGLISDRQGRPDEAVAFYRKALQSDPTSVDAHNNLGIALARKSDAPEALEHFREAVRLKPAFAKAHQNLGLVLEGLGQSREAVGEYRESLRYAPDAHDVARRLAWILATDPNDAIRNGAEAVRLASAASSAAGGKDPQAWDVLAAALAETGRFDDAVHAGERALELAGPSASAEATAAVNARLDLYRSGRPFRGGAR